MVVGDDVALVAFDMAEMPSFSPSSGCTWRSKPTS